MSRRSRRATSLFISLFVVAAAVAALPSIASDTVVLTLFQPETVDRSQGQVVRSFDVPATQGAFTLRVVNGDGAGNGAASSGSVKVNGATVVSSSDLNETVQTITKPLTDLLPGANALEIKVNSDLSAHVTVSITGEYLLNVAITEPLSGATIYGDTATVSGTYVAYSDNLSISVNGVPAALSGGPFVASGVPLQTGANVLTATAVTAEGIQDQDAIGIDVNLPPVAEAGRDRDVKVGSRVTLDGRDSFDREGDLISYGWTAAGAPSQSQAGLDDPASVTPSFVPDLPGIYVFGLVTRDGMSDSPPDNVTIGAHEFNAPPTAVAGPDNSVLAGTLLTLDGSGSFDPDGDPVFFSWTMVDRPPGSAAAPDDPSSPAPLILADLPGTYRVRLTVSDNQALSLPDDVVVRSSSPNAPPVAHAGPDRIVPRNAIASLDGTGSFDANGDPLTYRWVLVSKPQGSAGVLDNAASPTPTLFAGTEGGYVYRLVVNDGQADSDPATVVVGVVNAPPIAMAGDDIETIPGSPVTLDGGGSFDPNGDPITYQWSVASVPAGSAAIIASPNAANPVFEPDVEGTFVLRLVVEDGRLSSAPDNVTVTAWSPIVTVPNVLGMSEVEAQAALDDSRLNLGTVATAYSDTVASGYVVSQDPNHGSPVPYRSAVGLVVSAGPTPVVVPPDPVTVAPPVDNAVATTVVASTAFLYSGDSPTQTGVSPGTIDLKRAAVLRGLVKSRDGAPLAGVTIAILGHPEFGRTVTRDDGMFDMAVNGGGLVTVNYAKPGFLTAQRQVSVPWQDYAWAPDVAMVPYDNQVTVVDLASPAPIQVARGSVVSDADGTRQATVFVSRGTAAQLVFPDGSARSVPTLHIRATEYTAGPDGSKAMPAPLPPASAYTYCVELSADEAVSAGAEQVTFDRPVPFYVDNFLGFPAGIHVPVGYYDRKRGAWIPAPDGRVIRILATAGGLADLDTNGDGAADNAAVLASIGVTEDERRQLASLYPADKTLWRVAMTHFTPYDCNFAYACEGNCGEPRLGEPRTVRGSIPPSAVQCRTKGSLIECQSQVLGESASIVGTPFTLNYRSDREPGRKDDLTLEIPLSGPVVPQGLMRIDLEISVAGRLFRESFYDNTANQVFTFTWDGVDAYGRPVQGLQTVSGRVGYVYRAIYYMPPEVAQSFGISGIGPLGSYVRGDYVVWQRWRKTLGVWDARALGLGGWTLDVHHAYDPVGQVLHKGDGSRRDAGDLNLVVTTAAGTGDDGYSGDGEAATQAQLKYPMGLALSQDGSLYIADRWNCVIRKVSPGGIITTVAGTGAGGYGGDGGPATNAQLFSPTDVAVAPDGSFYIADAWNDRVRRVAPDGTITTFAGTGLPDANGNWGDYGDGGPATLAGVYNPIAVAVGGDGAVYIATYQSRVRRVGTDNNITTVAGTGGLGYGGDGGPATQASLSYAFGIGVGPDGSFYIADTWNHRVRRVGTDGIINTIAGTGDPGFSGDGEAATQAQLNTPGGLALSPDGSVFVADVENHRVRRIAPDGVMSTVAGADSIGYPAEGAPARRFGLWGPSGVAAAPEGSIYVAENGAHRIRKISFAFPRLSLYESAIASESGDEMYVFDTFGRHLRTINTLTGSDTYRFAYDPAGRLAQVIDADNNATVVERQAVGNEPFVRYVPAAIIAPGGQRTTLDVSGTPGLEYLARITNPAGDNVQLTYKSDGSGLLERLVDERGYPHLFAYDSLGRLEGDDDPVGGYKLLARTDNGVGNGYAVDLTTALGRVTRYGVYPLPAGGMDLSNTSPGGAQTTTRIQTNGVRTIWSPDSSVTQVVEGPDPRFGMQAPLDNSTVVWTPAGKIFARTVTRTTALANPDDFLSLLSQTDTTTVNGRAYTTVYHNATLRFTTTTPYGRRSVSSIDGKGRLVSVQSDNTYSPPVLPVTFSYDAQGRLSQSGQDNNLWTYLYDNNFRLWKKIDPLDDVVEYGYDDADRINIVKLPSGRTYRFEYDRGGNRTKVIMPNGAEHGLGYTPVNLDNSYLPPLNLPYTHQHSLDREWTLTTLPSGRAISAGYDPVSARLLTISQPEGTVEYGYADNTDRVFNLTRTGTDNSVERIDFDYDGFLATMAAFSGASNGEYRYAYDDNFWVTGIALDNAWNVLGHDNDGLLTGTGPFTIGRQGPAGAPDNVADLLPRTCGLDNTGLPVDCLPGALLQTYGYDNTGRLDRRSLVVNGSAAYEVILERDRAGRIIWKTETIGASSPVVSRYDYDVDGQLDSVWRNGDQWEHYGYDPNGNRNVVVTQMPARSLTESDFEYDGQDRLERMGSLAYLFDVDGYLVQRGTDNLAYSARGELLSATLSGQTVTYQYDGTGRRVARTDGQATTQYLYGNLSQPFQVTASRAPDNVLTVYYYDDYGALYALEWGGARYYVGSDHLGTPKVVTDNTGAIIRQIEYDSWGVKTGDTNPSFDLPVGFAGGIPDDATGLVRFGFRDYEPGTGRWAAKDPIFFRGGDFNLFSYTRNDPVNWVDAPGLWRTEDHGPNYQGEDRGWTRPENPFSTWRHFRSLRDVQPDLDAAIARGDMNAFRSFVHQGQDSFSHADAGYNWFTHLVGIVTGKDPDDRNSHQEAFDAMQIWTKEQERKWDNRWGNNPCP